ncbi:MaoC family dehydratase [Trujillonella endophytica]|uniref:Acyl dehydratase n=1 Tax=Trujillonella endophytica TaxID=673521 RepID=A0A1H8S8A8_9ACTN|nr:MaoC family dehydratase [Trujillella endophytica]SEO74825.1 Acyl dehydratase [Trujillella endophytica]
MSRVEARGPYFDELRHGQVFDTAPGVTLTAGAAAVHQAVLGDRLPLATDAELASAVTGRGALAHPAHVWDVAIGQSTVVTHFVRANLFYRGLVFRRFPALGDTLYTRTEVVGLKQNATREGRPRTGLAALHITTRDQRGDAVLDFHRCAMLPLSPEGADTGHADDLAAIGADPVDVTAALAGLDLRPLAPRPPVPEVGTQVDVVGGDVVSSAPELARLTLNVAQVHHDARAAGGRRLVYGGHTIGLAAAQLTRALPGVALFLGWAGCDHTGPVHEGDTLRSVVTVEDVRPLDGGPSVVGLRSVVTADADADDPAGEPRPVLDWRLSVLM